MVDGWIWKKGRLFFILQCWLINLDWMVKLENHYFAIIITKIDFGKELSVDAEYKLDILTRNRMFCCSVTQSCPNPMDCSTPGFPVLHYLPEFAQTCFHWVYDAIQPFHPLSPPSPALNLSQHQSLAVSRLFASVGQSRASASVLPMNIQGWFPLGLTSLISLLSRELSRVFSSTTVQKHQFFSTQSSLWSNSHIHTWLLEKP